MQPSHHLHHAGKQVCIVWYHQYLSLHYKPENLVTTEDILQSLWHVLQFLKDRYIIAINKMVFKTDFESDLVSDKLVRVKFPL